AGAELVALGDLLGGHLLAVGRRHLAVLDAGARARVDLVEVDALARDGVEQLDRDVDQPEADRAAPDRTGHASSIPCGKADGNRSVALGARQPADPVPERAGE